MPTQTIRLRPGVNADLTPSLNEAAFQATNLIRWKDGLPQKIGGWSRYYPIAIESIVRALHAWEDTNGIVHLGVAALNSLSVITSGSRNIITPQLSTDNPAVDFTTVMGSNIVTIKDVGSAATIYDSVVINTPISVGGLILFGAYQINSEIDADNFQVLAGSDAASTVNHGGAVPVFTIASGVSTISVLLANHGYSAGSTFPITVPLTSNGITLSGFYIVTSVTDANNFIINASNSASGSATVSMNSGNAQLAFYITQGPPVAGSGFGIGGFGRGGFGTGNSAPARSGTPITAIDYTVDNWGSVLVACPDAGPIFVWQPNSGLANAQMIANAPVANTGVFVAMPQQILVSYGASVLGIRDPLLIAWSTVSNYNVWIANVNNQAGSYRIPRGSAIIGGMQGPQYGLIWTDLAVWSMSYIGFPFVFSFNELASGCGMISKFGATTLGTTVFWISQKGFFALPAGGGVIPVPCSVWDVIFQNLNTAYVGNIRAASNSQFGEVVWYYPSLASVNGENDSYVKFTPGFEAWDYGTLDRSAWIDQSVLGPPIGASPSTNFIYQHETSNDADGTAINASFTTGYWASDDGEGVAFTDLVYPDMRFGFYNGAQTATVQITFNYANYAQSTVYQNGPYSMNAGSPSFINARFRARLTSMTVQSSDLGSFWRLGGLRVRTAPDGRL